jgi:hypothetical protein
MRSRKTMLVHQNGCYNYVSKLSSQSNYISKQFYADLIEVTSQPLATADLHIREPKNPFPPQTTIFLAAAILQ